MYTGYKLTDDIDVFWNYNFYKNARNKEEIMIGISYKF